MMGLVTLPLNSLKGAYTSIPLPHVFLPIYSTRFHGIVLLFILWNSVIDGGKPKIRRSATILHNLAMAVVKKSTAVICHG